MKIERFKEEDIVEAKKLAKQAWYWFYEGFTDDYVQQIAECILRHNFTDEDLSFKIFDDEGMKGLIFGTRKRKTVDLGERTMQNDVTTRERVAYKVE